MIKENPHLDINYRFEGGRALVHGPALVEACQYGSAEVVSFLLKQPSIEVNKPEPHGNTALMTACGKGDLDCVRLLMQHPGLVDSRKDGMTSLEMAVSGGKKDIVRWWIAAGYEIDTRDLRRFLVRASGDKLEIKRLVTDFEADPDLVSQQLSFEFKLPVAAAHLFALVIFATDGYLAAPPALSVQDPLYRFLQMVGRLPMEVQMIVCHRWLGSMGTYISLERRETAFRILARRFQPCSVRATPSTPRIKLQGIAQPV